MQYQYLSVDLGPCSDANHRHLDSLCHFSCQRGGDLLQHNCKASGLLYDLRILLQLPGLLSLAGPNHIGAELVNRLGCQAQVAHHRYPGREDSFDRFHYLPSSFHLYSAGAGLLHDTNG